MAATRSLAEGLAAETVRLYTDLEARLVADIARLLRSGSDAPDWATRKLAAVRQVKEIAEQALMELERDLTGRVEQAIVLAHARGGQAAVDEVAGLAGVTAARVAAVRDALPGVEAINRLVFAAVSTLRGTHLRILRWSLDSYRQVIAATSPDVLAGTQTRIRAAQVAWERLLSQGVTGFVDRRGRRWELASYVEMAMRTSTAHAAVQAHLDRLGAAGLDLVIVSNAPQECVLCRPWESKILHRDFGGRRDVRLEHATEDGRTVTVHVAGSVEEAVAAGLLHPQCRHSLSAYLPGVTKAPTHTEDPTGDANRQQLRHLERQVRAWKRREAGALTPQAKRDAAVKVRGWQAEIRGHVETTGLLRQRHREQIGKAR